MAKKATKKSKEKRQASTLANKENPPPEPISQPAVDQDAAAKVERRALAIEPAIKPIADEIGKTEPALHCSEAEAVDMSARPGVERRPRV